jgi:hypothetical protein
MRNRDSGHVWRPPTLLHPGQHLRSHHRLDPEAHRQAGPAVLTTAGLRSASSPGQDLVLHHGQLVGAGCLGINRGFG